MTDKEKAVLIIDMPQKCLDCPCSFTFGSPPQNICEAMNDKSLTKENMNNTKPNWCPLKPLPQKEIVRGFDRYEEGWNECIDELLGE